MTLDVLSSPEKPLTPTQAVLFGTLTVGTLDILDAFIFFGLRGVAPGRILQSIASGLLGKSSYDGDVATAALGLALHFFIAFGIVAIYVLASQGLPVLARYPWVFGPLYGLVAFAVMNYMIVPLSAAGLKPPSGASLVNGLLIHALGVGLPSALFARAARP